jgi:hypothetical protein
MWDNNITFNDYEKKEWVEIKLDLKKKCDKGFKCEEVDGSRGES